MTQPSFAQDPSELFDLILPDGTPTNQTKPRAAVHRDGDWHRAVHVWVFGVDDAGVPFLLVQRRNEWKDTWPGRLDATVGGHYRAGETLEETLRETEEEIGAPVRLSDLRRVGIRRAVNVRGETLRDNELQDLFLFRSDRPLADYLPNPAELSSLVLIPIAAVLGLFSGECDTIEATNLDATSGEVSTITLSTDDFIPAIDRYFYRVAIAAQGVLRGDHHVAV